VEQERLEPAAQFAQAIIEESQKPILDSLERLADQCEEKYGKDRLVRVSQMAEAIRLFVRTWKESRGPGETREGD
jgi:hypothetical protein